MLPTKTTSTPIGKADEITPTQLATQWKKTGQFDQLRKQLLNEFLNSSKRDELLLELDQLVPNLIATSPVPLRQIPRKDRPTTLINSIDKNRTLLPVLEGTKTRLTKKGKAGESRGIGRKVERELRNGLKAIRGVEGREDADELEKEKEVESEVEEKDEVVEQKHEKEGEKVPIEPNVTSEQAPDSRNVETIPTGEAPHGIRQPPSLDPSVGEPNPIKEELGDVQIPISSTTSAADPSLDTRNVENETSDVVEDTEMRDVDSKEVPLVSTEVKIE